MWLLLVAAGSGYLARCYQHVVRDESFRLAEIGKNRLLKTRDGFEFQSLETAAAETQLAVVEHSSGSSAHIPPPQFDPISKPSVSSREEPQILERHPNLDVYPPRDHQSWDAISSAAQGAGEQQDSQYAGGMSEGEATSVAGACSYPDEIHLLHTIRPKRWKLSHRMQDSKAPCIEDSDTVDVAGSAEDVVCRREEALFRCGVGIGVLLASKSRTSEIEKLQQLLTEAEAQLEDIEQGTKRSIRNHVPEPEPILQAAEEVEEPNQNPHVEFSAGIIDEDMMEETDSEEECVQILLRKGASSSSLPVEQIMELEAELEAELEQLTGQFSDDVVDKVRVESDDNDDSASEVPFMNNNYAVSPRELTRLLCKLQETLQEERISKLEADLESVETQLQLKEEELEKWKKHALCLSELSLTSTPGTLLGPQGAELCVHTGGVFSTLYGKPSPSTETISKSNESGCSSTVPGGQGNFQVPLQQPSGSSGFSLLDSFLDAQYRRQEGSTTGISSKDEHPGVDRRLDFGDALDALRAWNDDEVCDEFLQTMVDGPGAEPAWGEQDRQEASSECKPLFHELKKSDNLFVGVAEYLKPETSNSGSISPSISEFSDAVSMLEDWASGSADSATGPDSHPARAALQDATEIPDWIMTAIYGRPGETTISVSEVSDGKPRETTDITTLSSSTKYTDPSIIKSVPSCNQNPTTYYWNTDDRLDHVGVNTPINHHPHSRKQPILSTCSKGDLELLECGSGESSPRVADQIIFWDNLVRRGRPPLGILRGHCKCQLECSQSQASDLNYDRQQKQQQDYQDSSNVESTHCCKESLVVTADHAHKYSSGNLPFTTIAAERRMHGSGRKHGLDIFSSEAHAMLIAARPRCTTSSKEEEEEEEEEGTHRVQFSVQSGKRVEEVPKKLVSKDGIEAEEEEYKFLQRQLQHLRM